MRRAPDRPLTPAERELVARCSRGARRAVQLGVGEGELAAVVRKAVDPRGSLSLVDPYPGSRSVRSGAKLRLTRAGGADVVWLRRPSHEAAFHWWGPIDLLVIDGPRDWSGWAPYLAPDAPVLLRAVPEPVPPSGWRCREAAGSVALLVGNAPGP